MSVLSMFTAISSFKKRDKDTKKNRHSQKTFQFIDYVGYNLLQMQIKPYAMPSNSISNIKVEPPGMPGCENLP